MHELTFFFPSRRNSPRSKTGCRIGATGAWLRLRPCSISFAARTGPLSALRHARRYARLARTEFALDAFVEPVNRLVFMACGPKAPPIVTEEAMCVWPHPTLEFIIESHLFDHRHPSTAPSPAARPSSQTTAPSPP